MAKSASLVVLPTAPITVVARSSTEEPSSNTTWPG